MFTATRKTLLYNIIIVIFAENASFRSYGVICLPRMPLTTPEPQNTDTNGIHSHAYPQYKYAYIRELSRCVRADAYNLILIFASFYILCSLAPYILRMIRERHVILKVTLHSTLAV